MPHNGAHGRATERKLIYTLARLEEKLQKVIKQDVFLH